MNVKKITAIGLSLCIILSLVPMQSVIAATGADIVAEAERWRAANSPYGNSDGSGGYGTAVDCSGLVMQVYKKCGYSIPRLTYDQAKVGTKIEISDLQTGDICCFSYSDGSIGHVGIYVGNDKMIHAPGSGRYVQYGNYISTWTYSNAGCKLEYGRRLVDGAHTHSFWLENEAAHPHREYRRCSCGYTEYTGNTTKFSTCSQCNTPGKPSINNLWYGYLIESGNSVGVTFSWDATANTTHYNIYTAKKDNSGVYQTYKNVLYAESGDTIDFDSGEYEVFVQSTNSNAWDSVNDTWAFTNSDKYRFEVSDEVNMYGSTIIDNHRYIQVDYATTWHNAKKMSQKMGGHLATIGSQSEAQAITSFIGGFGYSKSAYFIGGTDENLEGNWEWVTGEPWSYNGFWNSGEPNNSGGNEHYLTYRTIGNDVPKTSKYGFICEIENNCGDNLTWELKDDILTISGTGDMYDYNYSRRPPWYMDRKRIKKIIIDDGVTCLGDYAFSECTQLNEVVKISKNVTSISMGLFENCHNLKNIDLHENITHIGNEAFINCNSLEKITIYNSLRAIAGNAFLFCDDLCNVYYVGNEKEWNDIMISYGNESLTDATKYYLEDEKAITTTTYKVLTSTYKFNIECSKALTTEFLGIACYDDNGMLLAFKQIECDGDTFFVDSIPIDNNIDYAKIFVWCDADNITPLAGVEYVDITCNQTTEKAKTNYAYVKRAQVITDNDTLQIRMFCFDGTLANFDLYSTVIYNGTPMKAVTLATSVIETELTGAFIVFNTTSNGQITVIDLPKPWTTTSKVRDFTKYGSEVATSKYTKATCSLEAEDGRRLYLTENTKIFVVGEKESDYDLRAVAELSDGDILKNVSFYNIDNDFNVGAILVKGGIN